MTRMETLAIFIVLHTCVFTALYAVFSVTHIFAVVTLCLLSGALAAWLVACVASSRLAVPPSSLVRNLK